MCSDFILKAKLQDFPESVWIDFLCVIQVLVLLRKLHLAKLKKKRNWCVPWPFYLFIYFNFKEFAKSWGPSCEFKKLGSFTSKLDAAMLEQVGVVMYLVTS